MREQAMTGFKDYFGSKGSLTRTSQRSALFPWVRQAARIMLASFIFLGAGITPAHPASDMGGAASASPGKSWLRKVPELIEKGEIKAALSELRAQEQASDADWHNLMGFAYRKQQPPDLARSEFHYQEALKIKPDHRGALEYYGELMLMKRDLAGAEMMLKRLDAACFFGCEEFRDLKKQIEAYKRQ